MPHPQNIGYYLGRIEEESLADALADFEDPLDGRAVDLLSLDMDDEFDDEDLRIDYDDY
jgi:hypothetical protein